VSVPLANRRAVDDIDVRDGGPPELLGDFSFAMLALPGGFRRGHLAETADAASSASSASLGDLERTSHGVSSRLPPPSSTSAGRNRKNLKPTAASTSSASASRTRKQPEGEQQQHQAPSPTSTKVRARGGSVPTLPDRLALLHRSSSSNSVVLPMELPGRDSQMNRTSAGPISNALMERVVVIDVNSAGVALTQQQQPGAAGSISAGQQFLLPRSASPVEPSPLDSYDNQLQFPPKPSFGLDFGSFVSDLRSFWEARQRIAYGNSALLQAVEEGQEDSIEEDAAYLVSSSRSGSAAEDAAPADRLPSHDSLSIPMPPRELTASSSEAVSSASRTQLTSSSKRNILFPANNKRIFPAEGEALPEGEVQSPVITSQMHAQQQLISGTPTASKDTSWSLVPAAGGTTTGVAVLSPSKGTRTSLLAPPMVPIPQVPPQHDLKAPPAGTPEEHSQHLMSVRATIVCLFKMYFCSGVLYIPKAFQNGGILFGWLCFGVFVLTTTLCVFQLIKLRIYFDKELKKRNLHKECSFGDLALLTIGKVGKVLVDISVFLSQCSFAMSGHVVIAQCIATAFSPMANVPAPNSVTPYVEKGVVNVTRNGTLVTNPHHVLVAPLNKTNSTVHRLDHVLGPTTISAKTATNTTSVATTLSSIVTNSTKEQILEAARRVDNDDESAWSTAFPWLDYFAELFVVPAGTPGEGTAETSFVTRAPAATKKFVKKELKSEDETREQFQDQVGSYILLEPFLLIPLVWIRRLAKLDLCAIFGDVAIFGILFYVFFFSMSDLFAKIVAAMALGRGEGVEDEAARRAAAGTSSPIISASNGADGSSAATAASTAFLGVEFFFGSSNTIGLTVGTSIFAFEGIGGLLPVYASMQEPEKFLDIYLYCIIAIGFLFCSFGTIIYLAFGAAVPTNAMLTLPLDSLGRVIYFVYALGVCATYPLLLFPAVRVAETYMFPNEYEERKTMRGGFGGAGVLSERKHRTTIYDVVDRNSTMSTSNLQQPLLQFGTSTAPIHSRSSSRQKSEQSSPFHSKSNSPARTPRELILINKGKFKWWKNCFRGVVVFILSFVSYYGAEALDVFVAVLGALFCTPMGLVFPPLMLLWMNFSKKNAQGNTKSTSLSLKINGGANNKMNDLSYAKTFGRFLGRTEFLVAQLVFGFVCMVYTCYSSFSKVYDLLNKSKCEAGGALTLWSWRRSCE
ncbi:unnamed protein product, partial [Amoebophrya sp. A120]